MLHFFDAVEGKTPKQLFKSLFIYKKHFFFSLVFLGLFNFFLIRLLKSTKVFNDLIILRGSYLKLFIHVLSVHWVGSN
ncbi:hypothetical protein GBO86_03785 [Pediococcus acidilactici]|nr:hypothetical protein GBO86_03785 [Pediococcus acidilactici]